jgi:hypothetical protein
MFSWLRASTPISSSAPPVKMKAPKGRRSSKILSGWSIRHVRRHTGGGEIHTAARVLTIEDQNSP